MTTMKSKLMKNFILIATLPILIIGIISYVINISAIRDKLSRTFENNLTIILKNLDNNVERIENDFSIIVNNKKIQTSMAENNFDISNENFYMKTKEIDDFIITHFAGRKYIREIVLFSESGYYCNKGSVMFDKKTCEYSFLNDINNMERGIRWVGETQDPYYEANIKKSFLVMQAVPDIFYKKTGEIIGIASIFLDPAIFNNLLENIEVPNKSTLIILDNKDNIILNHGSIQRKEINNYINNNYLEKNKDFHNFNDIKMKVFYDESKNTKWKIITFIPLSYFNREVYIMTYLVGILVVITFIGLYLMSYISSKRLTKPIRELVCAMEEASNENFNVQITNRYDDEMNIIINDFNKMVLSIKKAFDSNIEKERKKKEAQIRALQYQLNPHFLHNTLNTIRFTSLMNNDNNVAKMIMVLNRLLSNTIYNTSSMVTIGNEIKNAKDYLYLQQIRYNESINIKYYIDDKILDCLMPSMIIQPILENSLTHGLCEKLNKNNSQAIIEIYGYIKDKEVFIKIVDNGKGIKKEKINKILKKNKESTNMIGHIGLSNIREILKLQFGDQYDLTIKSEIGKYTTVRIKIPVFYSIKKLSVDEDI